MRRKEERSNVQHRGTDLGGHDQLVVDHVVGREAHSEEGAGGVKVARHASPAVDVLPYTLCSGRSHDCEWVVY